MGLAIQQWAKSMGMTFEMLMTETRDLLKHLEKVEEKLPEILWAEGVAKYSRELQAGIEQVVVPVDALGKRVEALQEKWEEWTKEMGTSKKSMEDFAKIPAVRTMFTLLFANIDRLGKDWYKVWVEKWIPILKKGLTDQEKLLKKAIKLREQFATKWTDTVSDIARLQNELYGKSYENVSVTAEKEFQTKVKFLKNWVAVELATRKDIKTIWIQYAQFYIELLKMLGLARELAAKKAVDKELEEMKRAIDLSAVNQFDKYAQYKELYEKIDELIKKHGLTDAKAIAELKERWKVTLLGMEALSKSFYKRTARAFGEVFASIFEGVEGMKNNF